MFREFVSSGQPQRKEIVVLAISFTVSHIQHGEGTSRGLGTNGTNVIDRILTLQSPTPLVQ